MQAALRAIDVPDPALPLADRLRDSGLLMITILAHGAAATSIGLALAIWIKVRRRRIAASVCVSVLVAVIWPIGVLLFIRTGYVAQRLAAVSPLWAANYLMEPLINRQLHPSALLWWIAAWDIVVGLFAIGVLSLAVSTLGRRSGTLMDNTAPTSSPAFEQSLLVKQSP